MGFQRMAKSSIAVFAATQMLLTTQLSTSAQAEMLSTEAAISKYAQHADRDYLLSELERQEIRDGLIAQGVDPNEAERRLKALSNEEIASIVAQMENETAGGSSIVGALVTIFIILLVTDLLCLTKVFSFTRCAGR